MQTRRVHTQRTHSTLHTDRSGRDQPAPERSRRTGTQHNASVQRADRSFFGTKIPFFFSRWPRLFVFKRARVCGQCACACASDMRAVREMCRSFTRPRRAASLTGCRFAPRANCLWAFQKTLSMWSFSTKECNCRDFGVQRIYHDRGTSLIHVRAVRGHILAAK